VSSMAPVVNAPIGCPLFSCRYRQGPKDGDPFLATLINNKIQ